MGHRHRLGVRTGRAGRAALAGALGALVLGACGSSTPVGSSSTSSSSTTSTVTTSTVTTSSVTSSTTGPAGSTCPTTALAVVYDRAHSSGGAAGSLGMTYEITNTSATACRLQGYPGLQLLDAAGRPLPTEVSRRPGTAAAVALVPGGHAWFAIQFPTQTGYGNLTCPRSTYLGVIPPDQTTQLRISGPGGEIAAYGGTIPDLRCGQIQTTPVTAEPLF